MSPLVSWGAWPPWPPLNPPVSLLDPTDGRLPSHIPQNFAPPEKFPSYATEWSNHGVRGHSWTTCNKLSASSNNASTVVGVIISSTVDEFCWQLDRLAVAKFSESRVWAKFQREMPLFWRYTTFLMTRCRIDKEPMQKPTGFVLPFR